MTNAEKYLKDEVDLADLLEKLDEDLNWFRYEEALKGASLDFVKFFNAEERKPTLTEDERVILRNIEKVYTKINRTPNGYLEVSYKPRLDTRRFCDLPYNHLFQFIKERRRIFNRRIIRR